MKSQKILTIVAHRENKDVKMSNTYQLRCKNNVRECPETLFFVCSLSWLMFPITREWRMPWYQTTSHQSRARHRWLFTFVSTILTRKCWYTVRFWNGMVEILHIAISWPFHQDDNTVAHHYSVAIRKPSRSHFISTIKGCLTHVRFQQLDDFHNSCLTKPWSTKPFRVA